MGSAHKPIFDFKGFDDFIQIATVGTHTASNGESVTFTASDFDEMIANTPPNEAPFVIGHPKVNAPAYGWGVEYKHDGEKLFVKGGQINPVFASLVESGAYKKRSFSVTKGDAGWKIKHIGWLGAAAPAITGMADVQFAADDNAVDFEFSDVSAFSEVGYRLQTIGGLFRAMRDKMIETDGIEAADRFFSEWQINSLQNAHESIMSRINQNDAMEPLFNYSEPDIDAVFAEHMLDAARAVIASEAEAAAALAAAQAAQEQAEAQFSARIAVLSANNDKLHAELARQTIETQKSAWLAAGKLTPATSMGVVDFMTAIVTDKTFEFSDGEAEKTISPVQFFTSFVDGLKPMKLGIEQAKGKLAAKPSDAKSIEFAAKAYQKGQSELGIAVSWTDACIHVSAGHED